MEPKSIRIAELARRGRVSTATLRYYEDQGLLVREARSEAGYRLYGEQALCRLPFLQRAKALGLTLREIQRLVQDPADPATDLTRLRHAIAHKEAHTL
jgi:MerR family Zn(II)-responsive transcriptional regulator of zntA